MISSTIGALHLLFKMALKFVIFSLLGWYSFQAAQCQSVIVRPPMMLPTSTSIFFDDYGNSILSSVYPYYNSYDFRPSSKLVNDYSLLQQLDLCSAIYNVPKSDLYQLDTIINNNMPSLPTEKESNMIQDLAKAIQDEKIRKINNPYQYTLNPSTNPSSLTMAELLGYLPSDFPAAYSYMLNYLDSIIPDLSPDALAEIQNAIYNNTPPSMLSQANNLTAQIQTAIRYMLSDEMYFVPNY